MKTFIRIILLCCCSALLMLTSACVKQPTTMEETVDLRPAISFTPLNETQAGSAYAVYVDGLAMGTADQYLTGVAALRVLSGSHVVELKLNGETVLQTKIYLGDGAVKALQIP
ncbi:hypothetical protein SAMN02745866_03073 [Alteromonadaceae bacterium Bs31]|nr:hypothetical protein SAMN02745866_03073 [Alteromonadaceae bacterium Bs31]